MHGSGNALFRQCLVQAMPCSGGASREQRLVQARSHININISSGDDDINVNFILLFVRVQDRLTTRGATAKRAKARAHLRGAEVYTPAAHLRYAEAYAPTARLRNRHALPTAPPTLRRGLHPDCSPTLRRGRRKS